MNTNADTLHWFHQGGFVMYILVIFSITVIAITLEKVVYMARIGKKLDALKQAVRSGQNDKFDHLNSDPLCPVYTKLSEIKDLNKTLRDSHRLLERTIKRFENHLTRGIGWLATIGNSAPFVGLLGTVLGIMRAFRSLSGGDPASYGSVSAGIAEALVATASGLVVAIPSVILYNYLVRRINNVVVTVRLDAEDFLEEMIENR